MDKIPETIIIERERQRAADALRDSLKKAHGAYSQLKQMPDLENVPLPHLCTEEWLTTFISEKKESVKKCDFLTLAKKQAQIEDWERLEQMARNHIQILQSFILSLPSDQYICNSDGNFYIRDIDALLDGRCTRQVPPDAQRHFDMIQSVKNGIQTLRDWERERDVRKYKLEELFTMPVEHFTALWATDEIRINHSFDHLPYIVLQRQIQENSYL